MEADMAVANQLFEKTDNHQEVREVIVLERKHDEFLLALIEEVRQRTRHRINKSSIVRTLIESIMDAGMESKDISNLYLQEREKEELEDTHRLVAQQISEIEADLRLALIDHPTETTAVRQLRRNLRYQKQRLRAVEIQMKMELQRSNT
jgi:hypothetical protein